MTCTRQFPGTPKAIPRCSVDIGGNEMAFSGSSYFAGIATAFAAIAVGFAGGAMVTTSAE